MVSQCLPQGLTQPPLGLMTPHSESLTSFAEYTEIVLTSVSEIVASWETNANQMDQTLFGLGPPGNQAIDVGRWGFVLGGIGELGKRKKRKAKATATDKAMKVVRRIEMKRAVVVVGFDFGYENWSVLKERRAMIGFGGFSS
ncbi:alkaline-phosphatase-like family protein [Actinidia rufa]|uniref:Alkaline-phosphatase-like family protein n=1 Tax=Actinidia rufa TaxID=165716 RepID=A0A7J0ED24_9ERIC|nr:alkaline-phosphatase-like family protein [Actinidia rufa]